ncbi:hypothetical protein CC78DRAFT_574567 [Lojkania enalia]|uniref:Uncharacterized protein n=1 Tax=Lojkania enalia TaxID=147567 RepID=A0A9P4NAN2_9PLEO|nr:hypothetical protein CC78DRAFT_574567 [Didymosphaeria enalia]
MMKYCADKTENGLKLPQLFYIGMMDIQYKSGTKGGFCAMWPLQYAYLLNCGLVSRPPDESQGSSEELIEDKSKAEACGFVASYIVYHQLHYKKCPQNGVGSVEDERSQRIWPQRASSPYQTWTTNKSKFSKCFQWRPLMTFPILREPVNQKASPGISYRKIVVRAHIKSQKVARNWPTMTRLKFNVVTKHCKTPNTRRHMWRYKSLPQ